MASDLDAEGRCQLRSSGEHPGKRGLSQDCSRESKRGDGLPDHAKILQAIVGGAVEEFIVVCCVVETGKSTSLAIGWVDLGLSGFGGVEVAFLVE